jgi:uncharacterized protein with NRDE domain
MCLILFAHRVHPEYRLVLAANRDEFHARPTAVLAEWEDEPGVFGGRDLQAGGTWLAVTTTGRWAAVTNYREFKGISERQSRSSGELVSHFVTGRQRPSAFGKGVLTVQDDFGGFNLLMGDAGEVCWCSNRSEAPEVRALPPGLYGVSNHLLDTPWPKVVRGRKALAEAISRPDLSAGMLLDTLLDGAVAADHDLPATGVTRDLERALSAVFTRTPGYGTRCSTALLIRHDGRILIAERSFGGDGRVTGETHLEV